MYICIFVEKKPKQSFLKIQLFGGRVYPPSQVKWPLVEPTYPFLFHKFPFRGVLASKYIKLVRLFCSNYKKFGIFYKILKIISMRTYR